MDFLKTFAENIESKPCLKYTNHNYEIQKVSPKNLETFLNHLKLVIPFFCEHPHSIL